jgi:hypothetical protein
MAHFEIHSRVAPDGSLNLNVPLGIFQANREVLVTVDSLSEPEKVSATEWPKIIEDTAGKWEGERLSRPDQGTFERRNAWA